MQGIRPDGEKSIVIILPWFGSLPVHYGMWRATALRNPSVDFMFFTDAGVESAPNIIVHRMSFEDFRQLVQSVFDFCIELDRPYKLCEYKQAYGYILNDYIKGYDFWGFGDIDLLYGDIRAFITNEVLKHKFILGWGHFTLLHNDNDTNAYFMKYVSGYQYYRDAFTQKVIVFFDEFYHKGCSDKWRDNRPHDCWIEMPFDNVSRPKESFHFCSLNRNWKQVVFEHIGNKLYIVKFCAGKLVRQESLYAHFQHRNYMKNRVTDYNHFLITPSGMIDYPKRYSNLFLRYYCRKRRLVTMYFRIRDYLLWRLGFEHWR